MAERKLSSECYPTQFDQWTRWARSVVHTKHVSSSKQISAASILWFKLKMNYEHMTVSWGEASGVVEPFKMQEYVTLSTGNSVRCTAHCMKRTVLSGRKGVATQCDSSFILLTSHTYPGLRRRRLRQSERRGITLVLRHFLFHSTNINGRLLPSAV